MLTEITLCLISQIWVDDPVTTLTVNFSVVSTTQVSCKRFRCNDLLRLIIGITARMEFLTATSVEIR